MRRLCGCLLIAFAAACGCDSNVPVPPTKLPEVAWDRYESIKFDVNSQLLRPKASVSVVQGQTIKIELRFRRVVYWKDLNEQEATIHVSVLDARRTPPTECAGISLAFVSNRDGVLTFSGEIGGDLLPGRYGLFVSELGIPRLEKATIFAGTLDVNAH